MIYNKPYSDLTQFSPSSKLTKGINEINPK